MRISAVVPVLDEQPTLEELHRRLSAVLRQCGVSYEILFVNDGSTDGSSETMQQIAARDAHFVAIDLRRQFGKTAALAAGFSEAAGEIVVTLDSDLQDLPEEIPTLLARLDAGVDLVTGRKHDRKDPWTRRAASRAFNAGLSLFSGMRVRDVNSGLKAMRREVTEELPLHGELHRLIPLLARARGFRVAEVDVAHAPRQHGRSRYGWRRYFGGLLDAIAVLLVTRYGRRPVRFFGACGAALAAAGIGILTYLTIGWFLGRWIAGRPLFTLGVLLVILGVQSAFFGLLAELVVTARREDDPGYSVRSVTRGA